MNPRSLDLWNCYCSWVNYTFNTQLDLIGGFCCFEKLKIERNLIEYMKKQLNKSDMTLIHI